MRIVSDIERIADHAVNIAQLADSLHSYDFRYPESVMHELQTMTNLTTSCYGNAVASIRAKDKNLAVKAIDEETLADAMKKSYRANHINRLQTGEYDVRSGILFLEMINNLERITDLSKNIAETVVCTGVR